MPHSFPKEAASEAKFRIAGKVAGIDACQLVSDCDEVSVGSALDCDLVVTDPLVPRKAFRLVRQRDHVDPEDSCETYWILETYNGARVYVNNDRVQRGRVALGDNISLGCHQFQFTVADPNARNYESNTEIDDLCDRLIQDTLPPAGYLESCPSWINRQRMRRAIRWTLILVSTIVFLWLISPREEKFVQVQPPMEVVVLSEPQFAPDPSAVRSLDQVQRKIIPTEPEPATRADIREDSVKATKELETTPLATDVPMELAKPAPATLESKVTSDNVNLPAIQVPHDEQKPVQVSRDAAKLEAGTQVRRLTLAEANDPVFQKELGDVKVKIVGNATAATPINQWSGPITRTVKKPSQVKLEANRAEQVAALERYKPSPLKFEKRKGAQIPIARLPEKLAELEVKTTANAQPKPGVVLDGEVTDSEISLSWKSGRFHLHAPGSPPFADPPTYCYVGKTEKDGRQFLYVSFVCTDPNVDQIKTTWGDQGKPELNCDDSIEIYLDVTNQRHQYYQMIVNAKGKVWAHVVSNSGGGQYTPGAMWDANQQLKTTINKQAGRWTCEVLLPFDRLGGVPAKGSRWAVNFCRNFRGQEVGHDDHLQNWFLVYDKGGRNYHNAELFGVFEW